MPPAAGCRDLPAHRRIARSIVCPQSAWIVIRQIRSAGSPRCGDYY
ncbi:MAG: hypothetical protein WC295_10860 [Methanoregula sp.]